MRKYEIPSSLIQQSQGLLGIKRKVRCPGVFAAETAHSGPSVSFTMSALLPSPLLSLSSLSLKETQTPAAMALVRHGTFSYDGVYFATTPRDDLRIRRATHESLCDITDPSGQYDHDLDWYRAQLMHYGLTLSNSLPTAKMRLLENFQDGTLTVPRGILKIEEKLKKEWEERFVENNAEEDEAVEASLAQRKLRKKLGSPFRFKYQTDVAVSQNWSSTKREAEIFPDLPEPKKRKSEDAMVQTAQSVGHDATHGVESPSYSYQDGASAMPMAHPAQSVGQDAIRGSELPLQPFQHMTSARPQSGVTSNIGPQIGLPERLFIANSEYIESSLSSTTDSESVRQLPPQEYKLTSNIAF